MKDFPPLYSSQGGSAALNESLMLHILRFFEAYKDTPSYLLSTGGTFFQENLFLMAIFQKEGKKKSVI